MSELTFSFFRNYEKYTGGHKKFYDYLNHTKAIPGANCKLFVQNDCKVMPGLFRNIPGVEYQNEYNPNACNVVFLAGMDWKYYLPYQKSDDVVVNLIQHVRHGDKTHPLFHFLKHRALRICVSEAVKDAIARHANGRCVTVPIGHDIPYLQLDKEYDLYILAKKNAKFGRTIAKWAESKGIAYKLHDCLVSNKEVSVAMAQSRVSLVLPNPTEGFFLPGIEAMALSDRAIIPDCIANREYCLQSTNSTLCDYSIEAVQVAVSRSLELLKAGIQQHQKERGETLARSYTIPKEREIYHQLIREHVVPLCRNK